MTSLTLFLAPENTTLIALSQQTSRGFLVFHLEFRSRSPLEALVPLVRPARHSRHFRFLLVVFLRAPVLRALPLSLSLALMIRRSAICTSTTSSRPRLLQPSSAAK